MHAHSHMYQKIKQNKKPQTKQISKAVNGRGPSWKQKPCHWGRPCSFRSGSGFMGVINLMAHNWSFWDRLPLCQKSFSVISSIFNY